MRLPLPSFSMVRVSLNVTIAHLALIDLAPF
jgi:hypothetical protein